jgi:hypothetical protein
VSKRTRIQITLETHSVTIIRQGERVRGWCRECADQVELVGIEGVGVLTGLPEPVVRIVRRFRNGISPPAPQGCRWFA